MTADMLSFDAVRAIIDRHIQDTPVDLDAIARDLGIPVTLDSTMSPDNAGKIVRESSGTPSGYAIYINAHDSLRRRRFTLAHEIAHFALHRDLIGDGLIDSAMYRSKLSDAYERQANRMAADMLMPAGLVRGLFRGGMTAVTAIADALNVSDTAAKIRLEELRLNP